MTPQNLMVCVVCTVFSNGLWMVCGMVCMVCAGFSTFFVGDPDAQCSCFRGHVTGHTQAMQMTFSILKFREIRIVSIQVAFTTCRVHRGADKDGIGRSLHLVLLAGVRAMLIRTGEGTNLRAYVN